MTQTLMLCLLLLVFNAGMLAQPSGETAFTDKNDSGSHDVAELQGCLQRSEGYYILVDTNNEYQRLSENKGLKKLVGHEVKLTGTPEVRTIDNTPAGGASSTVEQHYFRIKTVQDVTPNCHAYGK
jgi:hypothetical protein